MSRTQQAIKPRELEPFELALMDTFGASYPIDYLPETRTQDLKRHFVMRAPSGRGSFNLYNAHITSEHLEKICTHSEPQGPCWAIYITDFGEGVAEVTAAKQLEKPFRRKKGSVVQVEKKNRSDMDEEQLKRSVLRAKKNARHKCLALKVDRMLTFTTSENIQDRERAYKYLEKTIKQYNKISKVKLQYVAVMELQKRGAIHFHLATNTFHNVLTLRKIWNETIGGMGAVNVTSPKNYQRKQDGIWKKAAICNYITKYINKSYDEQNELNKKRFSSSRGIEKPNKITVYIPIGDDTFRLILAVIEHYTGAEATAWVDIPNISTNMTWFRTY